MLIGAIVAGLVLGLLAGGNILNLSQVRLRWTWLIFVALAIRFATELAISNGIDAAEALRLPLYAAAYALLIGVLWSNRGQPGIALAFVGVLSNAFVIVVNGGRMPVWLPSLVAAGLVPSDLQAAINSLLPVPLDANFLLHAGPLADVLPIPVPFVRNVASIGDLFLAGGFAFFLFATVVGRAREGIGLVAERAGVAGRIPDEGSGLSAGLVEAAALERPLLLGGAGAGMATPAVSALPAERAVVVPRIPVLPAILERARRHPFVRLSLQGSFSALWVGQLISLFGDRIHQIALAFLVLGATNSAVAVGAVFVAATLPNLLFGPIAGTFVDRWDHREVMVVSDLLRGAIVLILPVAAVTNLVLVYPLVFLVTTISIFFRPARVALLPQIVDEDDLLHANSAMWIGETLADIVGYPLAGLFVAFLGASLPLAFWFDAASYAASAVLLASIIVPPLAAAAGEARRAGFVGELREGWQFLRRESVLLANTLQGVAGQFMIGILLTLLPIYARDAIHGSAFGKEAIYSFLESGIGVGNLVGGFAVGLIGARIGLGKLVIVGYAVTGAFVALMGLAGNLQLAVGLVFGVGIGNLLFIIPSQTLFQKRVPPELMGRVVGFRFSLTFGSMTLAMAVGGVLGSVFGAAGVIGAFGLVTVAAGLAGLLVPSIRDA